MKFPGVEEAAALAWVVFRIGRRASERSESAVKDVRLKEQRILRR
jgi:hypothetical protein